MPTGSKYSKPRGMKVEGSASLQGTWAQESTTFRFPTTLSGTYDVSVKASHWLRTTLKSVKLTGDAFSSNKKFTLVNGDVNGDGKVNLADLLAISSAWRSVPGMSNYNPNADLNGDGAINLADWLIVSQNWRKTGDP